MDNQFNNIKKYSNFNFNSNSQKIGIFVVKNQTYQPPTYIRLLSTFNNLNSKFSACIIDVNDGNEINLVKSDLLNDNFLLDIIIISREAFHSNEFLDLLIKKCKLLGIKIIYELDDDLMNIDKSHRDYNYYAQKRMGIFHIAKNADVITVSTNALKSKLCNYNDNIIVIPNVITHYWECDINETPAKNNIIKIGYMGTPTHKDDIKLIEDAFYIVKNYFKEKNKDVIFEMIGGTAEKLSWANQIEISTTNKFFPNFVKFVKETINWDVAVAPLEDNNINASKSELKYLEYSYLEIPGVYSEIGPYKENIIHGFNGLLVHENSPYEWADNIIKLIENEDLRKNIIKFSKEDIELNHKLDIAINIWSSILEENSRNKNSKIYELFCLYTQNKKGPFINYIKENSYQIIENSALFDEKYYYSTYPDVKGLDPILHYLNAGYMEGCNPSEFFSTNEYLEKFPNLKLMGLNPLVHFVLFKDSTQKPYVSFNEQVHSNDFKHNFEILNNSNFFDEDYYLHKYPDVADSNFSAIEHWIRFGFNKLEYFRNPNNYFSKLFYDKKYLINGDENWNPLTHYALIGDKKGYKQNIFDMTYINYSNNQIEDIFNAFSNEIRIIIPVFNISDEIGMMLNCLLENTPYDVSFVFIIKQSLKKEFNNLLEKLNIVKFYIIDWDGFQIFDLINQSMSDASGDVVILNSYVQVTKNWLTKLIIKAYSSENVGIVAPISNLIDGISPKFINLIDESIFMSIDDMNLLIQKSSDNANIMMDYCDGSCIFIKNEAIKFIDFNKTSIGYYNDDNNLIFGLTGFLKEKYCILDDNTYVYMDTKFFKDNGNVLDNLVDKNSILPLKINEFFNSFELQEIKNNLSFAIGGWNYNALYDRKLYIIDEENEKFIDDFLLKSGYDTDCFVLTLSSDGIKLLKNHYIIKKWKIDLKTSNVFNSMLAKIFFNIIFSLNIEGIEILDFSGFCLNLMDVISKINITINVYLNNYVPCCPFVSNTKFCNLECNNTFVCPHMSLNNYRQYWKSTIDKFFSNVNLVVADDSLKQIYDEVCGFSENVKYVKRVHGE